MLSMLTVTLKRFCVVILRKWMWICWRFWYSIIMKEMNAEAAWMYSVLCQVCGMLLTLWECNVTHCRVMMNSFLSFSLKVMTAGFLMWHLTGEGKTLLIGLMTSTLNSKQCVHCCAVKCLDTFAVYFFTIKISMFWVRFLQYCFQRDLFF